MAARLQAAAPVLLLGLLLAAIVAVAAVLPPSTQRIVTDSMVVLIAVIASLFGLFLSAYLMRMTYADWRPMPEPGLLWGTTGTAAHFNQDVSPLATGAFAMGKGREKGDAAGQNGGGYGELEI